MRDTNRSSSGPTRSLMGVVFEVARLLSIAAFLAYGSACLFTDHMMAEFERFGLARMRRLTGVLEVSGAIGLLIGYFWAPLVWVAAAGLSLLMLLGALTRIRVRDPLPEAAPALFLFVVNAYVSWVAFPGLSPR